MGIITLSIALLIEVLFTIFRMIKKSNLEKTRSFLRIGAFVVFIILTFLSVIIWDFRWYGLAALLFLWTALGLWSLIRNKEEKKEYRPVHTVVKAIFGMVLLFLAVLPALIFPQYKTPKMTGSYQVNSVSYTFTDENRIETFTDTGENRKVNVQFWYPTDSENTHPLIIFSHGSFGVRASNTSTYLELASNGYVVCSIDHPYHSMFTVDSEGSLIRADNSYLQEVLDANNGIYDEETSLKLSQKWMRLHVEDMNFVLDEILRQTKNTTSETVYQRINPEKIGLMGHSLGGAASTQLPRERDDIDAVINLDADLLGEYLDVVDGKYIINDQPYPVPLLIIYSDDMIRSLDTISDPDFVVPGSRIVTDSPNAHQVHIAGSNHMSLTDLPLFSPFFVKMITSSVNIGSGEETDKYAIIEEMNSIVLSFFDVYLKNQGDFVSTGIQ